MRTEEPREAPTASDIVGRWADLMDLLAGPAAGSRRVAHPGTHSAHPLAAAARVTVFERSGVSGRAYRESSTFHLLFGPAAASGTVDAATLTAGAVAGLSVFEPRTGHWALPDATGDTETVEQLLIPAMAAGQAVRGRIRAVLLRGRLIVADGDVVDSEPAGTYLSRAGMPPPRTPRCRSGA